MTESVLALAAHPDDIEFMMAGTLILLGRAGYELHYMNIANGSCGTATLARDEIVRMRTEEAREAAALGGATFHPPLVDDLMIFYSEELLRRVTAVIREVRPTIVLLQSPQDYMEDHMNACRLGVSAAFCRGMKNYVSEPPAAPYGDDVALYHALPHGLCGPLREPIEPDFLVDIGDVIETKRAMLACHRSQKEWLDVSQGFDSYLETMTTMSGEMGRMSGEFEYAEGWRRHLHLGYGPEDFDPLGEALAGKIKENMQKG